MTLCGPRLHLRVAIWPVTWKKLHVPVKFYITNASFFCACICLMHFKLPWLIALKSQTHSWSTHTVRKENTYLQRYLHVFTFTNTHCDRVAPNMKLWSAALLQVYQNRPKQLQQNVSFANDTKVNTKLIFNSLVMYIPTCALRDMKCYWSRVANDRGSPIEKTKYRTTTAIGETGGNCNIFHIHAHYVEHGFY